MSASFAAPAKALMRPVGESFARALRMHPARIDPLKASAQSQAYARVLAAHGVPVEWLPGDEACPDACFIEDTAVILSHDTAFVTRPGAPARRAEVPPVARHLQAGLSAVTVLADPGAHIDGGDVLRCGDTLLVGLSERTNQRGIAALAAAAGPLGLQVQAVPLQQGLHLKSVMTLISPGRGLILKGHSHPELPGSDFRWLETDEPLGANLLALGDTILVSASAPHTLRRLQIEGLRTVAVDVSELHKADGALTCLSLRLPPAGHWCA